MTANKKRRGLSCGAVAGIFFGLIVLAGGVGAFGYFKYLKYDRVAALHVPESAQLAARVDVEKIVLYSPVREHLLPLLEHRAKAGAATRLERIEAKTGVVLSRELREFVVARGQSWSEWVIVIGGRFQGAELVPVLAEVLREDGVTADLKDGTLSVAGLSVGHAEDGVLLVASSAGLLEEARSPGKAHERLGVELEGPGGFGLDGALVRPYSRNPLAIFSSGVRQLGNIERVHGRLELSNPPVIVVDVELRSGGDPQQVKQSTEAILSTIATASRLTPGADFAGERAAIEGATVKPLDDRRARVTFPWSQEAMGRGAESLARLIQSSGAVP